MSLQIQKFEDLRPTAIISGLGITNLPPSTPRHYTERYAGRLRRARIN